MSKPYESASERLAEEQLYRLAAEEIAANVVRPGLWAQALALSEGDDSKAKALYLNLRVQAMKDEALIISEKEREAAEQEALHSESNFRSIKSGVESLGWIVKRQAHPKSGFRIIQKQSLLRKERYVDLSNMSELTKFFRILWQAQAKQLRISMKQGGWLVETRLQPGRRVTCLDLVEVDEFVQRFKS